MCKTWVIVALLALCWVSFASQAHASLGVMGGNLHAFADAGAGFTSAPPDQPFAPPTTSILAQVPASASARETVSFASGQISVSPRTFWVGYTSLASGTLSITENSTEPMWVRISPHMDTTPFYGGLVSLDEVGGPNIFSVGIGVTGYQSPLSFVSDLSPGQYTLTWSEQGQAWTGVGGSGGFDFVMGVPEPSSMTLLGLGALGILARRRRTKGGS